LSLDSLVPVLDSAIARSEGGFDSITNINSDVVTFPIALGASTSGLGYISE
jgi:hypothetical protein